MPAITGRPAGVSTRAATKPACGERSSASATRSSTSGATVQSSSGKYSHGVDASASAALRARDSPRRSTCR